MNRRGAGLFELLVALTITALLATLTSGIVSTAVLRLRERSERLSGEYALRVGAETVRAALESLGTDSRGGADLSAVGASGFTARAPRASGVLCSASAGLLVARDGPGWWSAVRNPVEIRDSLLVGRLDEDSWQAFALEAPPRQAVCPDGSPGIGLPVSADSLTLTGLAAGSPLRIVEWVELRLYTSSPDEWLGMRLLSGAQPIQPFAGPMQSGGLTLRFADRLGIPTSVAADVAEVGVRLGSLTERAGGFGLVRGGSPRLDSVAVFVALPNVR